MAFSNQTIDPSIPLDNRKWARVTIIVAAGMLFALIMFGFFRWMTGLAPRTTPLDQTALALHFLTVVPAIPLGAYVLFVKKGGSRHRLLGKIFLVLMLTTATATFFVQNAHPGHFTWVHILSVITLIAVPRAYFSARRGDFRAHRANALGLYVGPLLIAGFFTFMPGRMMWAWAFG